MRLLECDRSVLYGATARASGKWRSLARRACLRSLTPESIQSIPTPTFRHALSSRKTTLHLPDWSLIDLPVFERRIHETYGITSALYLPLVREGECIGVLALAGTRAGMFAESEITLAADPFADQAVIAIENTRLFNEVRDAPATSRSHWSSRPRRRKYWQGRSAVHSTTWRRCSRKYLRTLCGFAAQTSAP